MESWMRWEEGRGLALFLFLLFAGFVAVPWRERLGAGIGRRACWAAQIGIHRGWVRSLKGYRVVLVFIPL